ncbi:hypothetical protein BGZ61DRAFT_540781 [Ilyonectria robusta]|uniref:uncharacterized protein n=1 Tax=Ilyonectria robusta TaxID=1079257 RepID=UPI001E8EC52B|nr:uncharacterized protein BGZ61DRAFT_540781 [Ilyonectria robusta]KAH8656814.1 hypothetical protein BGZ61DRAFT_540781 [Ilyonectria robusta]
MAPKSVLLFGATGYIGGAFLSNLHARFGSKLGESFCITLASRRTEKARKIQALIPGSTAIELSLQDLVGLEEQSQKHDIIVQIADCDDLEATSAILRGMKTRRDVTGEPPILYHTSGAAFLLEDLAGYSSATVTSDLDSHKINAIPLDKPHRNVDDAIVKADDAGHIRSYILVPTVVFGKPSGLIHQQGLANLTSMGIGAIISAALGRRAVGRVGPAETLWSLVHVDDVASLLLAMVENPPLSHGRDGFYVAENGSRPIHPALHAAATVLYSMDLLDTDKPTLHAAEEPQHHIVCPTLDLMNKLQDYTN